MQANPYIIKIVSQKGGVGKTTISTNFATVLQEMGNRVLLVDFDISNPTVGFHLGIENQNIGVSDILKGKTKIESTIVIHAPTGMHIIPGNIGSSNAAPTPTQITKFMGDLRKTNYDFIIFDTAPGYLIPEVVSACNEAIIITTPEMSACTSCIRLANAYKKHNLKSQFVINRIKNKRYELHPREIEEMYGAKAAAVIPEDEVVPESIAMHISAYLNNKNSFFAKSIYELSLFYSQKEQNFSQVYSKKGIIYFIKKIFGIIK